MIKVEDIAVSRGGVPLLSGISFEVSAGKALVLRGPNGLGKTSLLRGLAGLQDLDAGSVTVDPETVVYAAHADGIKHALSVRENLEFWAATFGTQGIDHAIEAFELGDLVDRATGTLSAGQKRRVGLARLLVTGRKIWILDEPTVSLDRHTVLKFGAIVSDHLAKGGAAIIATHIDLGLPDAEVLELALYRVTAETGSLGSSDEAFL